MGEVLMRKGKKTELIIGIVLLVLVTFNMTGVLAFLGVGRRFFDLVVLFAAIYMIVRGLK